MICTYDYNGQTYTIQLERASDHHYTATIGERTFPVEARPLPDGAWLLTLGGVQFTVYGAAGKTTRSVHAAGKTFSLAVPDTRAKRRGASGAGGDLTAQMPGQIVDVLVSEGDSVQAGQTLVILEAMKMEIRVTAPGDGRVRHLLVEKGAVVERGQRLLEMEAASPENE
jgi:biotin carboxyl carrier protein